MKRLILSLLFGQSLRHRAVALKPSEQRPVRAIDDQGRDITASLFPISLSPLLLGLADSQNRGSSLHVRMEDAASSQVLGELRLASDGSVDFPDVRIPQFRPTRTSVSCIQKTVLAWRYALAWRQAQRNLRDPHAFHMSFPDLRALNVFYMMPRPVYLISVVHEDASNIFPMDLVGPFGDDRFLLALRLTSPSVELMRKSGRFVAAGAPAAMKPAVYQLGAHHKKRSIEWGSLPIRVEPSPAFGIPTVAGGLGIRELEVIRSEPVGSHMVFLTSAANRSAPPDKPQLCHVSDMYARWRERRGLPFADA